jgi:predicted HicB family RNase H-like nuclease
MRYKGYEARVEYSEEDGCFVGHLDGIQDVVGFHGQSVDEVRKGFRDAVDDYLEVSRESGRPPQKPCSGKILIRLPPDLHAKVLNRARASGKSLNQWAREQLERAL